MSNILIADSAEALAARIPDGAKVALFKDCGVPMALGRALVRRGVRDLHVVTVPTGGLLPDMLIGAGCVATIETAGVSLGEFGLAPRFVDAVKTGRVRVLDATCPALYAGLQAAEKGIPFMPLRGLIGSDVLANRPDFAVIDNPFGEDDPIVALPAIQPDAALLHVPVADRFGNVFIGRQAEFKIMAHAARATYVTCETLVDFNLLEDERYANACLNALYVDGVACAPAGAAPLNLPGHYDLDAAALKAYAAAAATPAGFADWLARHVAETPSAAA
ncbi:MAG: CoA transferase subunit A [Gammaproteobacteria bacterium]